MSKHKKSIMVQMTAYAAAALSMFVAGMNVATMYPSPAYTANWWKVAISFGLYIGWLVIANVCAKENGNG